MATIACPNCDRQINRAATRCKYCGWAPGQPTIGEVVALEAPPIGSTPPRSTPPAPPAARKRGHPILLGIGILVLVCVGLTMLGVVMSSLGLLATPTPAAAPAQSGSRPTVPADAKDAGAVQSAPPTTALATAVPAQVGTRQNPVPRGEIYTFRKGNQSYSLTITDVQKNALSAVKKANMFNADPPDGEDYILVKVRLAYLQGGQDKPMTTTGGEHRFYADNRFWGAPTTSVPPKPDFTGQDLFPGGNVEGWLAGKHLPRALMDQAVLVYDSVYFAL